MITIMLNSIGKYLFKEKLDEVVKTLLEGLNTDGGHHKQYYLETALRQLCTDEWVDETQKHFQPLFSAYLKIKQLRNEGNSWGKDFGIRSKEAEANLKKLQDKETP